MPVPLHAVIISWQGHHQKALSIAEGLDGAVDRLSVIYSNEAGTEETGPGDWIAVPQSWYFGRKFRKSLELCAPDEIMLQIQADADYADWPGLAADCARAFAEHGKIGIWAPDIDWTPWPTSVVGGRRLDDGSLIEVDQTDGIVWAMPGPVLDQLRGLDYDRNNLGWGIDWAALGFVRQMGLRALRDTSHKVLHPQSRGYDDAEAAQHMKNFVSQLPPAVRDDMMALHADLRQRRRGGSAAPDLTPDAQISFRKKVVDIQPMIESADSLAISEIHLAEDRVFVLADPAFEKSEAFLHCGALELPFQRCAVPPGLDLVPRSFPMEACKNDHATLRLNGLGEWQVSGWDTLRAVVRKKARPMRINLGGALMIEPGSEPLAFTAALASHRARGQLVLVLCDEDGTPIRRYAQPFVLGHTGGDDPEQYQYVRAVLPAPGTRQMLMLQIEFQGDAAPEKEDPPAFFIAQPTLQTASAGERLTPVSVRLGRKPASVWYECRFPRADLAWTDEVSVVAPGGVVPLLPTQDVKIAMVSDWGHMLEIDSSHAMPAMAWINGAPAFRVTLSEGANYIRIPLDYLTGRHSRFELRDPAGCRSFFDTWILPPFQLTPAEMLQNYGKPPFPTEVFAQSHFRFKGLRAHYAAGTDSDMAIQISQALEALEAGHEKLKLKPLHFPQVDDPDVSIVIPAHNKINVTYAGLCGLLLAWNKASFEVIVVDDASTDETANIEDFVSGITVLHNDQPQRFIRACNAGAAQARGKYVVLLNNDTEPTAGWLDELIAAFERFPDVGLVGSKLLYPNGMLQDAGGIIWNSGNPWNYGNRQNPWDPRFRYARQADYLSGAAMMTTREIWDEVGGLSAYLEPMYFEDTDFAFKVRAAGYSTWFVPSSVVFHYEGMTSGTDVSSGFKRFQEVNRPKFKRRWAKAFSGFGAEGRAPDLEKDRGIVGRVLFIDYTTPMPDQSAGGFAALQEIRLVQSLGYKVTFLPENLAYLGGYTEELEKMGVEVIVAPFARSLDEFLEARGLEFDAFYITRYSVVNAVVPKIRQINPQARILMNNADLHFLRLLRKASAEKDDQQMEHVRQVRSDEFAAMRSVDVVLSYNEMEHAVIEAQSEGAIKVMTCPWVVDCPETVPPRQGRQGLSFLGGFQHHPNVEGVEWFAKNVMSLIEQERPDIQLTIYGSRMGDDIKALETPVIKPVGFVEQVADAYDRHLVFVAPLLSGAGIKGKVLNALAHGVPCVLSPLAAEGIGLRDGHDCLIADSIDEWIAAITRLTDDEDMWQLMSDHARTLARSRFSFARGREQMRSAFEAVELFGALD